MLLKNMIVDSFGVMFRNKISLFVLYLYVLLSYVFIYSNGANDYTSMYSLNLFVAFAISAIGCKESGLKLLRFDFQFRMTFVYLTLLLIHQLTTVTTDFLNQDNSYLNEVVSGILVFLGYHFDSEVAYKVIVGIVLESVFYCLLSPLMYLFASLRFAFKKILSLSISRLFLGIILFVVTGFVFAVFGLIALHMISLYVYIPIFSLYNIILVVLAYVVGKNSFVKDES